MQTGGQTYRWTVRELERLTKELKTKNANGQMDSLTEGQELTDNDGQLVRGTVGQMDS